MKYLTVLMLLICFPLFLSGQVETSYVKYRFVKKNGTALIGQIVEKMSEGPYHILLDNGVTIEIKENEILRFYPLKSSNRSRSVLRTFDAPSYTWGLSTEVMAVNNGIRHIGESGLSTGASVSVQRYLKSDLAIGLGLGMYNYDLDARRLIIPAFAEVKYRVIKNFTSPVISIKSGYGWAAKNYLSGLQEHRGGYFINPFVGYEFGIDRKISWTVGVGLLFQKAYYAYTNGQESIDEDIYFKRMEFKLGISIH